MTIFIRTSGGGGIVLLIALALIAGHGSGIGAALAAALIALVVLVVAALVVLAAVLVHRIRRPVVQDVVQIPGPSRPLWGSLDHPGGPRALAPSLTVHLEPEQLAELAELIRRGQRPE